MSIRQGLLRGLFSLLTLALVSISSHAYAALDTCESDLAGPRPLTLAALRESNSEKLRQISQIYKPPGFIDLAHETTIEQVGEKGPLALQQLLGANLSFVMTPAPTAPMDTAVYLHEEGKSFPVHVDQEWAGRRTSTTVYASLPKTLRPHGNGYLVGPEYPVVLVHLHGGGTPTATGKNAMSIGQALANDSIPVLGMDMPGHGRATRQLKGLTTFQGQVDWLLAIIDQLVDPRVKIVLSGHSRGGEFAVFMERHSHEPKYARIAAFIAASPPVDVSLGGDEQKKLEFERRFEEEFESYRSQIAPSDFEFHENLLRNGKTSDVGSYATAFSSMDYQTPRLTPEQQAGLKKILVIVGKHDGMVYVGRESFFTEAFGNLIAPSKYIVLDSGTNWKSSGPTDLYPTGHNIWDRYIDGTTTYEAYDLIRKTVLEEAPQGMGSDEADEATIRVSEMLRNYSNFFLFRELVANSVDYVQIATPSRTEFDKSKLALETYIKGLETVESRVRKETEVRLAAALSALRKEVGLTDSISVRGAHEELSWQEMTEARRAELQAYVAKIKADEERVASQYKDSQFDLDLNELRQNYNEALKKIGVADVLDYFKKYEEYDGKKGPLSDSEAKIRTMLSRLHQQYTNALKAKQSRYTAARDLSARQIQPPPGTVDYKSAERELKANSSPERRQHLQAFVDRAPGVEASVRAQIQSEVGPQIESLSIPENVTSDHPITEATLLPPEVAARLHSARALRATLEAMRTFTYAPPGDADLARLSAEIHDLNEQRARNLRGDGVAPGIERLDKVVKDLTAKRAGFFKTWDGLWKMNALSSPKLREFDKQLSDKLEHYRELYYQYEYAKSDWLLELKKTGRLDEENILAGRPDLKVMRLDLLAAKEAFEQFRDQYERLRWQEGLEGHLDSDRAGAAESAIAAARAIWGASRIEPSPDSIMGQLRVQRDQLEFLRRTDSILGQRIDRKVYEYSQLMNERGHPLPSTVRRVSVREALELPYADLIAQLRSDPVLMDTFRSTLKTWQTYLGQLRKETQSKDTDNY